MEGGRGSALPRRSLEGLPERGDTMQAGSTVLVGTVHADLDGFRRLETVLAGVEPRVVAVETNARRAALYAGRFEYDALGIYREAHRRYLAILDDYVAHPSIADRARQRYAAFPAEWTPRQMAAMEAGAFVLASCYGFELKVAVRYVEAHPGTELRYIDLPEEDVDAIQLSKAADAGPSMAALRFFARNQPTLEHGLPGCLALIHDLQDACYAQADGELRRRYEERVANWERLDPGDHYHRAVFDPRREPHMARQLRDIAREDGQASCLAVVGATHLVGLARLLDGCEHATLPLCDADARFARAA